MPPSAKTPPEIRKLRDKELEQRRSRGEISCAECRRLKLKCDKKLPCSSCVRRGCPTICPNGSLSAGQGTRFVLADTTKLHRKLLEMSKRIRQLEDGLEITYASISSSQHPLLSEDLLAIKGGLDTPSNEEAYNNQNEDNELDRQILDSFGSLAVSDKGTTRFIGRSGTEVLLAHNLDPTKNERDVPPGIPLQLAQLGRGFPFTTYFGSKDELLIMIEAQLPSYERASALIEAYLENLSWFFRPVDREQIIEELLPSIYKKSSGQPTMPILINPEGDSSSQSRSQAVDVHDLSLLLIVFAVGAVADMTLPPDNDEANLYYHLCRATMSLQSILDDTKLTTVQTIALMGAYDLFSCREATLEGAWKLLTIAMCLASSVGLHRDPSRWKLDSKMTQRRRAIFWELYSIDSFKGVGSGRPSVFHPDVVDCELPIDKEATLNEEGEEIPSYWHWKHCFVRDVMTSVSGRFNSARPLKYSEILDLDQRVREFGSQWKIKQWRTSLADVDGIRGYVQRHMITCMKDIALLFIHRNFFAKAMLGDYENPLQSIFSPSFLAAYRSATMLLRAIRENFHVIEHLLLRLWPIWAHSLTSSVILGSIASRGRACALSRQAFIEFDLAVSLFEKSTMHPVVKNGLPMLLRMREKAYRALHDPNVALTKPLTNVNEAELRMLGAFETSQVLNTSNARQAASYSGSEATVTVPPFQSDTPFMLPGTESPAPIYPNAPNVCPEYNNPSERERVTNEARLAPRFTILSTSPMVSHAVNTGDTASTVGSDILNTPELAVENMELPSLPANFDKSQKDFSKFMSTIGMEGSQTPLNINNRFDLDMFGPSKDPITSLLQEDFGGMPMESLLQVPPDAANFGFDVDVNMQSYGDSVFPSQSDAEMAVADAWRTIFQDSRFFNYNG